MRVHAAAARDAPAEGAGASRAPLLSGALKNQALDLAGALAATLRRTPAAGRRDVSLASGSAGLAVCDGQLARTRCDPLAADAALTRLEEAVGVLATVPLTSSLYSGFTGIAWAVDLVGGLLGTGGEDRNGDIDEALTRLLQRYPEDAPYDLIDGLTGLGVYALARWPRPGAAQCDPGVAAALLLAARDAGEPAWAAAATGLAVRAAARPPGQAGVVDAGLCHGSAGLAHLFSRMYQMTAEPALADAARFWVERTFELCSAMAPGQGITLTEAARPAWKGPGLLEAPRASRWPWRPRPPPPNPPGTRCCSSPPREL